MEPDFLFNGQASGSVAARLLAANMDPRILRPFIGSDGRNYVVRNDRSGKEISVVQNSGTAVLLKDDWKQLDTAVLKAAKPRLQLWADLQAAGLTYDIPNGMGKTTLQYQTQSDISLASVSMSGLRKADNDKVEVDLRDLPLPIVHKDFEIPARQLATSRNNGHMPLDTTMAELAARRVAETVEMLALGTYGTYQFGGGLVYGVTNFNKRMTRTIKNPTDADWTPAHLIADILAMKQQARAAHHYGPFNLYFSPNWDQYLDADYNAYGTRTLRQRIAEISGINSAKTLDYLATSGLDTGQNATGNGYDVILVQMTPEVIRAVTGMPISTVQWTEEGGLLLKFKVMCIMVPQLRYDFGDHTGIVHASAVAATTTTTAG